MKMIDGWKKVDCPVCGKTKLVSGLKIHIITTAKQEVYDWYLDVSSPKPHQDYVETKVKLVELRVKKWEI